MPTDADPSDDFIMDKGAYVLSYNRTRGLANWVAWRLTADDLGTEERADDFRADDQLPPDFYRVLPSDYARSGYDRGHMCPSSHRTKDAASNSLTFSMTNMQPQVHSLNAGPWKSLETYERELAGKLGKDVYVIAGGVFTTGPKTIGQGVAVPRSNYRITVVIPHGLGPADVTAATPVYAVEMPNDASAKGHKWAEFSVSVDEIEQDTGYNFLSALPDTVEDGVEATNPTGGGETGHRPIASTGDFDEMTMREDGTRTALPPRGY
jgi:endonuclease G